MTLLINLRDLGEREPIGLYKKAVTDRPGRLPSLKPEQRWCGCIIPKDYPQIDIHTSKCLRINIISKDRSRLKGPAVGKTGHIPKDESQAPGSDAPWEPTPTHQSYFRLDGSLIKNKRGTKHAWRAFDNRRRRNVGDIK